MLTYMKNSVALIPVGLTPRAAATICQGSIMRNVSILGRTQTVVLNAAPVIPDETIQWMKRLRFEPGMTLRLPHHVDEFHAYYWINQHPFIDENDMLSTSGAPMNILGSRAVTVSKGVIKNVVIAD